MPDSVRSYTQLESYLPRIARQKGININKPFPFLIEGKASSLNWHVIDWKKGNTEHTHEKHQKSGAKGMIKDAPSTILGFYSQKHQRIWTHHSTYLHMHALLPKENLSVHIDDVTIKRGTSLKIPKI